MSEAPERIWAWNDGYANRWDYEDPVPEGTEYVRADLAEAALLKAQLAIQEYTIAKKAMNTIWNEALEQAATVQVRNGFDDRVMYELHPMLAAAIRALRQLEE